LDAAKATYTDCCCRRDSYIEALLRECDECWVECCGIVAGTIDRQLDQAEGLVGKLHLKQDQAIQREIGAAYNAWVQLGGAIPDNAAVAARLEVPPDLVAIVAELVRGRAGPAFIGAPEGAFEVQAPLFAAPAPAAPPAAPLVGGVLAPGPGPLAQAGIGIADMGAMIQDELRQQIAANGALPAPDRGRANALQGLLQQPGALAQVGKLVEDALRRAERERAGFGQPVPRIDRVRIGPAPVPPVPPPVPRFPPPGPRREEREEEEKKKKEKEEEEARAAFFKGTTPNWCFEQTTLENVPGNVKSGAPGVFERAFRKIAESIPLGIGPVIASFNSFVDTIAAADANVVGCKARESKNIALYSAVVNSLYTWLGIDFPGVRDSLAQAANATCPQKIPTAEEARGAYLANVIQGRKADLWYSGNGYCPPWQHLLVDATRTRPNVGESISLHLRGKLTLEELQQRLRGNGVLHQGERNLFLELANFIPPPTDLTSFMVRDIADEEVVKKYGYDESFNVKFAGRIKDWARAQGMTEDQFRYVWRAHWRLVSPTQGFEMLHRLRPGAVPNEIVTEEADVLQLLEVDDYPPFWRRRLMAISYRPLTRVDTQRAYFIGSLDLADVKESYLDQGYDEKRATVMQNFTRRLRVRWIRSQLGLPGPAALAGMYADRLIDRAELTRETAAYGFDAADVQLAVDAAEQRRRLGRKKKALAALRTRYMAGMVPNGDAIALLVRRGFPGGDAQQIVTDLEEERSLLGRHITVRPLCRMADRGVITREDYLLALMRLGFRAREAQRLVDLCAAEKGEREERKKKRLSPAQLCAALQDQRLTVAGFTNRLTSYGYDQADADLVASACLKAGEAKDDERRLTVSQICQAQLDGLLTETRAVGQLRELGFGDEAALILATSCSKRKREERQPKAQRRRLTVAQLCKGWKAGLLSADLFVRGLGDLGYEVQDAHVLGSLCGLEFSREQREQMAAAIKTYLAALEKGAAAKKAATKERLAADAKAAAAQRQRLEALAKARRKATTAAVKAGAPPPPESP